MNNNVTGAQLLKIAREAIRIEAEEVLSLSSRLGDDFVNACEILFSCHDRIVVTGVGKSGHIASKIAATLASTGSPAFFMHPSEAVHGDIGVITKRDVVLALSFSGNTSEVLGLIPVIKLLGVPLITITGNPESKLARAADVNLDASIKREACPLGLAPTSSTTVALVLGDALAISLIKKRGFTEADFARSHPGGVLGKRLLLHVEQIMRTGDELPIVSPVTTVAEALFEMTQKGVGMTLVADNEQFLRGIFTDGDLRRVLDRHLAINELPIAEVMTTRCQTIKPGELAIEALQLMESRKITALPVLDEREKICGVVHIHDLLKAGLL